MRAFAFREHNGSGEFFTSGCRMSIAEYLYNHTLNTFVSMLCRVVESTVHEANVQRLRNIVVPAIRTVDTNEMSEMVFQRQQNVQTLVGKAHWRNERDRGNTQTNLFTVLCSPHIKIKKPIYLHEPFGFAGNDMSRT